MKADDEDLIIDGELMSELNSIVGRKEVFISGDRHKSRNIWRNATKCIRRNTKF